MNFSKVGIFAVSSAFCAAPVAFASDQSDATGFASGAHMVIKTRNMFMQRDFHNSDATQNYGEEWAQGVLGIFESGFTQGTVGFGVDAIGQFAFKLDTGGGRYGGGTNLLETDSHGPKDEYSKAGGVLKMRISNTVLKYGTQITTLPILGTSDSRLLPETVDGFSLTSREIKDLRLDTGHFTGLTNRNQTSRDSGRMTSVDYLGGVYNFSKNLSSSAYFAKTDEYFKKWYFNTNYRHGLSEKSAYKLDFNFYDTKSIGEERALKLDNYLWSLAASYSYGPNTFLLAHQRVSGKGDYTYGPDGNGSYIFSNTIQYSDFDYEDEKSWQARYDLDVAAFGAPGLSLMTRYVKGYDFKDGRGTDIDGKAWERDVELRYVVQSGPAKNLSVRARQATYRSSERGGQVDEVRIITEYPINIF